MFGYQDGVILTDMHLKCAKPSRFVIELWVPVATFADHNLTGLPF